MMDRLDKGDFQVHPDGGYTARFERDGHSMVLSARVFPTFEAFLVPGQIAEVAIKLLGIYTTDYADDMVVGEKIKLLEYSRTIAVGQIVGFSDPWVRATVAKLPASGPHGPN